MRYGAFERRLFIRIEDACVEEIAFTANAVGGGRGSPANQPPRGRLWVLDTARTRYKLDD